MSEAKHSPLPWRKGDVPGTIVCDNLDGLPCKHIAYYGGELVCESCQDSVREFIIRAANCHDDLLEALRDLLAWANIPDDGTGSSSPQALSVAHKARAAIAKATG